MATLARLSFWVPTARIEDFHEAYDRLLTPLFGGARPGYGHPHRPTAGRRHLQPALGGGDPGGRGHPDAGAVPGCGLAGDAAAPGANVWDDANPGTALAVRALSHPGRPGPHPGWQGHPSRGGYREPIGMIRYDGEVFTPFTSIDELSHNVVTSMLEDDQGKLWFGTQGG